MIVCSPKNSRNADRALVGAVMVITTGTGVAAASTAQMWLAGEHPSSDGLLVLVTGLGLLLAAALGLLPLAQGFDRRHEVRWQWLRKTVGLLARHLSIRRR